MAKRHGGPGQPSGEDEPPPRVESSIALENGFLAEEVVRPNGPQFVLYHDDPESYPVEPIINGLDSRMVPRPIDPKLLGSLRLPEGVVRYESAGQIVRDMEALSFEVYDPGADREMFRFVLRLAVASWVLDLLYPQGGRERFAPIIQIVGLPENGKGRFETVCREFCYRSLYLNKTVKVPSLFRSIEPWNGTLILDEADLDRSSESSEFIEFLNGRSYGNPILRYSAESDKVRAFQSFGYTILATRKPYEDAGFNSRAIILRAEAAANPESIPLTPDGAWYERALRVRCQLLLFRFRVWTAIRAGRVRHLSNFRLPGLAGRFRVRASFLPLAALEPIAPELMAGALEIAQSIHRRQVTVKADSTEGRLLGFVYQSITDSAEWSLAQKGTGWRLEKRSPSLSGEEVEAVAPMTLASLEEVFGGRFPRRTLSNTWKNFGQAVKERERYGKTNPRSTLEISDPRRLCREFLGYIPDAESLLLRFGSVEEAPEAAVANDKVGNPASITGGLGLGRPRAPNVPRVPSVPLVPRPGPLPSSGRPGRKLSLDTLIGSIGSGQESELDRAIRVHGPTITYPDGTVTDRRSGRVLFRPVALKDGPPDAGSDGTRGTSGTIPVFRAGSSPAEREEAALRWADDGGRPGGAS